MEVEYFRTFITFCQTLFSDIVKAGNWLVADTSLGVPPIALIGFSGLMAYLTIAIVRWLI